MLSDADLLHSPLEDLTALARVVRDGAHGRRVTYSPKVFIPLTMLCRDRCGYCTFAKAPARVTAPYLLPEEVLAIAAAGKAAGCHEALFTLGERPEERYPVAAEWLAGQGYASTVDYLAAMCRLVLEETGLLPHANAGALDASELAVLRPVAASQGMMLESLAEGLDAHRGAPDKVPARRLATLEHAGALRHPVHHRHPGRHRRQQDGPARRAARHCRRPRPPRPRAGGHRPELPAQAGHGHVPAPRRARPRTCSGPLPRPAWSCRPRSTCRRRPTSPTTWRRCWPPASTTGAACRPSPPTTSTPSGPGRRSTSCAPPPRPPATRWPRA